MTHKDKLEELCQDFAKKLQAYVKGDDLISKINGFGDVLELEHYQKAYQEFQNASNDYHNFAFYIIKNKIDLDTEFLN
ncbi:hypothetical protein EQG63_11200 [Flavobacterium amnicola]|uniref:Uncharacterized protein n=1 Tax=Flavobacterium amnicola TaxID=2506422 RepID=A0A4Q1K0J9_9FLAO|nr:hypothetical protein [Flavobacterium amnicola]RXR17347.1 hypothetical protein EQG63_11200 [Flavobacterium amnicola]